MAPLELIGDNLGKKHQHYNKLLKEAIQNPDIKFTTNFKDDGDINTLLQIDVACINRNVEFILEVLKCEDMLYISRAVKRSTWLITDPAYVHIMNIEYLKTHLFPYMMTEAINKLMLSIRLHIKEEDRAEAFFNYYEKRNLKIALKWLPHCSLPFIEQAVTKHRESISNDLLYRLCERSISVLEVYIKSNKINYLSYNTLKGSLFLIKNNANKYLDIIENLEFYEMPHFGRKHTEILMKACPQKILDKFEKFAGHIDYAAVAKNMKKEDIKQFLLKLAGNEKMKYILKYDNVKHFLKYMPREGRFEFIKQMFINKESIEESMSVGQRIECRSSLKSFDCTSIRQKNVYNWYMFAPFDTAFRELKKLMRAESAPEERNTILIVLLHCAGYNVNHIHALLQYYNEKHINEPFKFKIKFLDKVLQKFKVIKDINIWSIINRLFHSMEVYIESTNNVQKCVETIIVFNAIHGEPIPKIIEQKFTFNTLKHYRNKLSTDEKEKVFNYLYNHMQNKLEGKLITSEERFNEMVNTMKTFLDLINDWEKNLKEFPVLLTKIKELTSIKQENSWNVNLTSLYNVNKTWRKYMFDESIILWPSESVCINALKHDPSILSRHHSEMQKLLSNDTESLTNLLKKIRVYWPFSLTTEWTNFYLQQLENPSKHKAAIKALIIILPQDQLIDIIKKYAPDDSKINWGAVDELSLSLRKSIAKNMCLSRPLLPAELILLYTKGDYLQYAVPSLSSILAKISCKQSGPVIQELLTAPVSLQKYGIRLAFAKLKTKELKPLFSQAWQTTTNATIRSVLFENTYHALCKNTNSAIVEELWELLSDFIHNLSHKENKKIYNLMGKVKTVPYNVKGKFYMKSVTFLKSMPPDDYIENIIRNLIKVMPYLMEQLDTEFIANVILNDIDKTFVKSKYQYLDVIATHALYCNDQVTQTQIYEQILGPLLDRHLPAWDEIHDNKKYIRSNIEDLLKSLVSNLTHVFLDHSKIIPVKMFTDIQHKLETLLSMKDNFTFITTWKLITAFIDLVNTSRPSLPHVDFVKTDDMEYNYERQRFLSEKMGEIFKAIIPSFAKVCTDNLQVALYKYFPSIYLLYGQAVYDVLEQFDQYYQQYLLYKHMLTIDKSTENYLLVNNYCSIHAPEEHKALLTEIRKLMESHPSLEVQMHCIDKFHVLDNMNID